jgi:hypothetical protein
MISGEWNNGTDPWRIDSIVLKRELLSRKEAQQATGDKSGAVAEAKKKLKEAEDKKKEADMLAKQREALAQKAAEEQRLAEEALQEARRHAATAADKEDDLHS